MQSSEEVSQINSALIHCNQLKTQLQGTLLHIQRLNTKYNQTDYMAVIHNLENYRRSSSLTSSPYPKIRPRDQSIRNNESGDDNNIFCSSTPVRRPPLYRRMQLNSSTPKRSALSQRMQCNSSTPKSANISPLMNDSSCQSDFDFDTPKRSVRELKANNNTISVRTIKVQRNIEAIITQLQVLQKSQKKRQIKQMEQSLYQSCCNSSMASPGYLGHSYCTDSSLGGSSFVTAFGSTNSLHNHSIYHTPNKIGRYNDDQKTLERMQRFYATPLQRMHKRLINLNASLISTC